MQGLSGGWGRVRIGDTSCLLAMIPSQISSGQSVSVTSKYSQPGHRALSIHHILLISYFPFIVALPNCLWLYSYWVKFCDSILCEEYFGFWSFCIKKLNFAIVGTDSRPATSLLLSNIFTPNDAMYYH